MGEDTVRNPVQRLHLALLSRQPQLHAQADVGPHPGRVPARIRGQRRDERNAISDS
jgi:hypothetical protein